MKELEQGSQREKPQHPPLGRHQTRSLWAPGDGKSAKSKVQQLDGSRAGTDLLCSPRLEEKHHCKGVGEQVYFSFVLLITEITLISGLFQQVRELIECGCSGLLFPAFL